MVRSKSHMLLLTIVSASALLLAACAAEETDVEETDVEETDVEETDVEETDQDLESLEQAAISEGALTVYASEGVDVVERTIAAFMEDYPEIQADFVRLSSAPLSTRFLSEDEAGIHEADVFNVSDLRIFDAAPELFQELDVSIIPSLADVPSEFVSDDNLRVATSLSELGIIYNTDLVDEAELPETDEGLLDERWRSKMSILDPRSWAGFMAFYDHMANKNGLEYLERLAEQDFQLGEFAPQASQQVAAGGFDMAFPVLRAHNAEIREEGAAAAIHGLPQPVAIVQTYSLPAEQPHPNAGRLFLHWLMTGEGPGGQLRRRDQSCPPRH